jgi:hypothetical protein
MDSDIPQIAWASNSAIQAWPSNLDVAEPERFSDVDGDDAVASFWSTPRECFRSELEGQWRNLSPKFLRLLERVSSTKWQVGCDALGLQVPRDLESTDKWIVVVGSLYEPEVGVVLSDLARFVQETLRGGESGFKYLQILDAGIPSDPVHTSETWVTCPASLHAQFLYSLEELSRASANAMVFYTTSIGRAGFRVSAEERIGCALGVLRSYFTSSLLSPRDRADNYSSIFRSREDPIAVTPDRLSVFVEFTLDLSNLDKLIAHELLARWKRRFFNEGAPVVGLDELTRAFHEGMASTPDQGEKLFDAFTLKWFKAPGVNPGQQQIIEEFRDWIKVKKENAIEARECLPEVSQNVSEAPAPASLWQKVKAFFGFGPSLTAVRTESRTADSRADLLKLVEFSHRVLKSSAALLTLLNEISTPESVFQDVTYDTHLEITLERPSTIVAQYRRLPLGDQCPPYIAKFLTEADARIPALIMQSLYSPEQVVDELLRATRDLWRNEVANENAETRWGRRGIVQWIRQNPAFPNMIAEYAVRELVPLWKPLSWRADNWLGFITVFEFGVDSSSEPSEATTEAFNAIKSAFNRTEPAIQMTFGAAKQRYLDTHVVWERWPSLFSIGFLWTDTARRGMGFSSDWDKRELDEAAKEWKIAYPTEWEWICSRPPATTVTGDGGGE